MKFLKSFPHVILVSILFATGSGGGGGGGGGGGTTTTTASSGTTTTTASTTTTTVPPDSLPPPSTTWSSPQRIDYNDWPNTSVRWQWWSEFRGGTDKVCAANSAGDGWVCTGPILNAVRWTGYSDPGGTVPWAYCRDLALEVLHSTSLTSHKWFRASATVNRWPPPSSSTAPTYCSYPDNVFNPYTTSWPPSDRSQWRTFEFSDGGYAWGWIFTQGYWWDGSNSNWYMLESDDRHRWYRINTAGAFATIDTIGNINLPPIAELLDPIGDELHRQGVPEHHQDFSFRAEDPDGHNWTARAQIQDPDGFVFFDEIAAGNGITTHRYRDGQTATVEVQMPHKNGTYRWRVRPTDTSGTSTAEGDWTAWSTFEFIFNLPPGAPERLIPESDAEIPEGEPVSFVIETTDPEGDPYQGVVEVQKVGDPATRVPLETTVAASGDPAAAQLADVLEPGEYEWRAMARDVLVNAPSAEGDFNPDWQRFTVARTVSNTPPGAPTLVAPPEGHVFAHDDDQVFTVLAVDGDTTDPDPYVGVVSATHPGTGEQTTFVTDLAASGTPSSGSPPVPFEQGTYVWSAVAVDARGGVSDLSESRGFAVAAPPSEPTPGAPVLVSPEDDGEFAWNDLQRFVVNAPGRPGGLYRAGVRVDGEVVCETAPAPFGEDSSCLPFPQLEPGSYTWDAQAVAAVDDTPGPWSNPQGFTVWENRPPNPPSLERPDEETVFRVGEAQLFAINAEDPDGDPYRGEITVVDVATDEVVRTFTTAESPSGSDSYGVPTPPLPPGEYTWNAVAIDVGDARSDPSPSRALRVNRPPEPAVLVAPAAGHTFGVDEPQVFTINAEDPDDDLYSGVIEVRDAVSQEPLAEHTFQTALAPSGINSRGTPLEPLPPGEYEWRAIAVDIAGAESQPSGWRTVSIIDTSTTPTTIPPTTTTTVPDRGSQVGVGAVSGRVELAPPGLPPILAACEPTSFTFLANTTALAIDLDGAAFAGAVSINGGGGGDCEKSAFGTGTISVSATGTGPGNRTIHCPSLDGDYQRFGAAAVIELRGECTINDTATSDVMIRTAVDLRPDDGDDPIAGRVTGADFEGVITVEPM